jgi:hypothetical protein
LSTETQYQLEFSKAELNYLTKLLGQRQEYTEGDGRDYPVAELETALLRMIIDRMHAALRR